VGRCRRSDAAPPRPRSDASALRKSCPRARSCRRRSPRPGFVSG
jgi:hypothetical protein